MITLNSLKNTHRPKKKVQRVGRGMGSNRGKTCGRGGKGDSARCGYKRHFGNEGGQMKLFRKLPCRGFSNAKFSSIMHGINLGQLDKLYKDGEEINWATLREKGYAPRQIGGGLKILGEGELKKKVSIEAHAFSKAALEKLEKQKISFKVLESRKST